MITPSAILTPNIIVTAALYAAGNNVGGLIRLPAALKDGILTGKLQSLSITDHANQKAPLDLVIFDSQPAAVFVDKAAMPVFALADSAKILHRMAVVVGDYVTIGGTAVASFNNLERIVQSAASGDLWAAISTSGTPTYANAADLVARFGVVRD